MHTWLKKGLKLDIGASALNEQRASASKPRKQAFTTASYFRFEML